MTGYVLINGEKCNVSIFGGIVHSRPEVPRQSSRKSNPSERRAMTPIEAAAREIESEYCQGNRHDVAPELAEIITRHLFPVVKPEDVDDDVEYWALILGRWETIPGRLLKQYAFDELRGPIPMPEVRS